jgi:hypothetical protein
MPVLEAFPCMLFAEKLSAIRNPVGYDLIHNPTREILAETYAVDYGNISS